MTASPRRRVYPRVGGGTRRSKICPECRRGLSPRGRGNPIVDTPDGPRERSIPAWAGEPDAGGYHGDSSEVYPRVGGGTGYHGDSSDWVEGLSPRGRGNPSPRTAAWTCRPSSVYPRVGGGTAIPGLVSFMSGGLSPRGRGNLERRSYAVQHPRSIPAWAGEPEGPRSAKSAVEVYPRVGGGTPTSVQ